MDRLVGEVKRKQVSRYQQVKLGSKYTASRLAIQEGNWVQRMLCELLVFGEVERKPILYQNNQNLVPSILT